MLKKMLPFVAMILLAACADTQPASTSAGMDMKMPCCEKCECCKSGKCKMCKGMKKEGMSSMKEEKKCPECEKSEREWKAKQGTMKH